MKRRKLLNVSWIARRSTGLLGVTVVGGGLMVLAHIALARVMSQADYGALSYALGCVEFLVSFALIGLPTVLTREVAGARAGSAVGRILASVRFVRSTVLATSVIVGGAVGLFLHIWARQDMPLGSIGIFATMVFALALAQLDCEQALMRGLRAPVAAAVPNQFLRPLLILGGAALLHHAGRGDGDHGLLVMSAAMLATLLVTWALANRAMPPRPVAATAPEPVGSAERIAWMRSGVVITAGNIARNLQHRASFIVLGFFVAPAEIALFAVALQLGRLIQLALSSVANVASPVMAEAIRAGDHAALRRAFGEAVRWVALVAAVTGVALAAGGPFILDLYGPDYGRAYDILLIVAASRLVAALTGPTGAVMLMGGDEAALTRILWLGGGIAVASSFAMVPAIGAPGAAWAMLAGVVVSNVQMLVFLRRKYDLRLIDALLDRTR